MGLLRRELRRRLSVKQQVALAAGVLLAVVVAVVTLLRFLAELAALAEDEARRKRRSAEAVVGAFVASVTGAVGDVLGTVERTLRGPPAPTGLGSGSSLNALTVGAGETHTVAADDTESYIRADIDGTLTVNGTLTLTG